MLRADIQRITASALAWTGSECGTPWMSHLVDFSETHKRYQDKVCTGELTKERHREFGWPVVEVQSGSLDVYDTLELAPPHTHTVWQ